MVSFVSVYVLLVRKREDDEDAPCERRRYVRWRWKRKKKREGRKQEEKKKGKDRRAEAKTDVAHGYVGLSDTCCEKTTSLSTVLQRASEKKINALAKYREHQSVFLSFKLNCTY